MAKRKPNVPRELPKRLQGQRGCQATINGNAQICVEAGKFGWQAWLTKPDGTRVAPISIGRASSVNAALRAARTTAERIRTGQTGQRNRRR